MCDVSFSAVEPHMCDVKSKRKLLDPFEPLDEDYGIVEAAYNQIVHLRGHTDLVSVCQWNEKDSLATG